MRNNWVIFETEYCSLLKTAYDIAKQSQLFNSFFAKQCFLINNNCKFYETEKRIHIFSIDEIGNIIPGLDPNKAHGQDKISISMLKIYGNSICKSLEIIYQECLSSGLFLLEWKKESIVPIHKKGNKQCLKYYIPLLLLPVCAKNFEKLIFNKMFQFFIKNKLIARNQSGFKSGDPYINQLLWHPVTISWYLSGQKKVPWYIQNISSTKALFST